MTDRAMTILVLAPTGDGSARGVARELARRHGHDAVGWVTPRQLASAGWRHRIDGRGGVDTEIRLAGACLRDREIEGVFHRLPPLHPPLLATAGPDDRAYGHREMTALVLSWLAGLGPRVSPTPRAPAIGLGDRGLDEWHALAEAAGLDSKLDAPTSAKGRGQLLVVGDRLLPMANDRATKPAMPERDTVLRFARKAGAEILGLVVDEGGALVAVDPMPELATDGAIGAVADLVTGKTVGAP